MMHVCIHKYLEEHKVIIRENIDVTAVFKQNNMNINFITILEIFNLERLMYF